MKSVTEVTEFDKVKEFASANAITEPGRELTLSARVYDDAEKIREQLTYTTEARRLLDMNLILPLEHFCDLSVSLKDAKAHIRLSGQEIFDIAELLRSSRLVKQFFEKNSEDAPTLNVKAESLFIDKEFEEKVFDTFDSSMKVKESASPELKKLYKLLDETNFAVKATISRLLSDGNFTSDLRDTVYTQRNGRTVFQVKAEAKNKVLGIVYDVSATGQTYFIEPKELTELHNKQREIEVMITAETERILKVFSEDVGKNYEKILKTQDLLAEIDFHFAKGKYSLKIDGIPAEISETPKIVLQSLKNPVLMSVCDNVVENDFNAGMENLCTIITGSNTGGKTVILKTIGLAVLMSKAGFHFPCTKAVIYPFRKIFADIGDHQNIIQSLSTFSSHVKNLVLMTTESDENTLILIDEVCSGTDPAEGAALASAILKNIVSKKAFSVVTTHYGDLKKLALSCQGFENACVHFDSETLKPTYRFTQGISGSSNAVVIAENLGLDKEITEEAKRIYSETTGDNTEKLSKIEKLWEDAQKKNNEATKNAEEIELLKAKLLQQTEDLKKEKRKIINDYKKKTQHAYDSANEEIKGVLVKLRENENRQNAMNSIRKNTLIRKNLHDKLSAEYETLSDEYIDIDFSQIKAGDKILIRELNQEAVFVSISENGKKAEILIGNVKSTISVKKLAAFDKRLIKPSVQPLVKPKKAVAFVRNDISYTLDLRGMRYEEAMEELENYLDKACASGLPHAIIIHGHGTGVLKKAVREYIANSPYIAKFRPGEDAEGGDGVSVVDLN